MSTTQQWRSMSIAVIRFCVPMVFFANIGLASAADPELEAVRARIEGVYALEERHTESGVFRPPQVEGRSTLL